MTIDLAAWASWGYLLIFALVLADAVIPLVPGETILLAGGVLAADGEVVLAGVIAAAATGAFVGDLVSYRLGRVTGPRLRRRIRGRRGRRAMTWSAERLDRHGLPLLVSARFVPGGRTASTLTAGLVRYPQGRFAAAAVIGGTLWAASQGLLGFAGGELAGGNPIVGMGAATVFALGFGVAAHALVSWVGPKARRWALAEQRVDGNRDEQQREVGIRPVEESHWLEARQGGPGPCTAKQRVRLG